MSVNDTDWKFVANLAIIEKTLALFRKISGNSGQWRLKKRRKRESVQQQWNFSVKIKQWKINWFNFKPIYFLPWILKKSKKPSKSDFQAWILPKKCATQLLKIWQLSAQTALRNCTALWISDAIYFCWCFHEKFLFFVIKVFDFWLKLVT